jgi:hypothetical protein
MRMEGNDGVYPEQAIELMKEIRGYGINARWLHDADRRVWFGQRTGVVEAVVIPFIVGIASSGGWAAIAQLLSRKRTKIKLKIGYRKIDGVGQERWVELEGKSTDIATTLEQINPWRGTESLPSTKPRETNGE